MDDDIETYVHRIGRTGRKQNKGFSYAFFTDNTKTKLAHKLIEVLVESNNEVPAELRQIARTQSHHHQIRGKNPYPRKNNNYHHNEYRNREYNSASRGSNFDKNSFFR